MATAEFDPGMSSAKTTTPKMAPKAARPTWLRWLRAVGVLLAIGALVSAPWWGPQALAQLDFFHARRVVFEGVRYARPTELVAQLKVDTLQSIWQPLEPLVDVSSPPHAASSAARSSSSLYRRVPVTRSRPVWSAQHWGSASRSPLPTAC